MKPRDGDNRCARVWRRGGGTQEFQVEGFKSSKSGDSDDRHIHDQVPASVGPRSISLDLPVSVFCQSTMQSTKVAPSFSSSSLTWSQLDVPPLQHCHQLSLATTNAPLYLVDGTPQSCPGRHKDHKSPPFTRCAPRPHSLLL